MIKLQLQYFGGRGASGVRQKIKDWLRGQGRSKKKAKPLDYKKLGLKSLEDVEKRIRNIDHEELFVFDKDDKIIDAYKGDKDSVAFPTALLSETDATVTHGHPKGTAEFGGTFSFADINNMLDSQWKEHRATASGQGEMNYIMRRTANADSAGLRKRINQDIKKLENNLVNTYKQSYLSAIASNKSNEQALHIARQKAVGELNAYYKEVMPQYGFEYIVRKKNYKYNR